MADPTVQPPLVVTAERRPQPAMQKLARALINLVRLRQNPASAADARPASPQMTEGVDHA